MLFLKQLIIIRKKRLVVRSNTKPQEPADNTRVQ